MINNGLQLAKAATTTAKILHFKEKTNLLTVKKFLEHDVS